MDTDQVIATAAPALGAVGGSFYFAPATLATGKELGLDGMRWYVIGRGGVLGDVEPAVVTSAFGWFHPASITKLWSTSCEKVAPRVAGKEYLQCAARFGRERFAGVDGLDAFNAAAETVVAAAHPAGLALFAAIAAEPRADDAPARAMQLAAVLRELRGSAHLLAVLASGLTPVEAHFMRRPDMMKSFGYAEDAPPQITDAHRARLDAAERLTDDLVRPAFAALDAAGGDALATGAQRLQAALAG